MNAKSKAEAQQLSLTFPRKDLWEQFPQTHRVRCRELIVQLLQAVVFPPPKAADCHERKNQT